ncbi:MAG: exo-alpha-sialidase [Chloroflexi bacterium]|nr:exo-alpha-sialidase [Chloroflexota bacterium]
MRKLEDVIVYRDARYYATFPSVVARSDGELLVAFRRAPERRRYFAPGVTHTDPNAQLVLVRSRDLGATWSSDPELIYAHPLGGSQDPCMVQLADGSLLTTSYAWMLLAQEALAHGAHTWGPTYGQWHFTFLGGYLMRSLDAGCTWQGPVLPPHLAHQREYLPGVPVPAWNRGAIVQAGDGALYWVVATDPIARPGVTMLDLLVSVDGGQCWEYRAPVAWDERIAMNETSLVQTEAGDLVGFVRSENNDDHGLCVRSRDMGHTWEPWQDMGFQGHPFHGLRLSDGRILIVYGYRHPPFGVRARLLDPDCRTFATEEVVLRADGGSGDLGYPWACQTAEGRILCVYYHNREDGTREIAGTFVALD